MHMAPICVSHISGGLTSGPPAVTPRAETAKSKRRTWVSFTVNGRQFGPPSVPAKTLKRSGPGNRYFKGLGLLHRRIKKTKRNHVHYGKNIFSDSCFRQPYSWAVGAVVLNLVPRSSSRRFRLRWRRGRFLPRPAANAPKNYASRSPAVPEIGFGISAENIAPLPGIAPARFWAAPLRPCSATTEALLPDLPRKNSTAMMSSYPEKLRETTGPVPSLPHPLLCPKSTAPTCSPRSNAANDRPLSEYDQGAAVQRVSNSTATARPSGKIRWYFRRFFLPHPRRRDVSARRNPDVIMRWSGKSVRGRQTKNDLIFREARQMMMAAREFGR